MCSVTSCQLFTDLIHQCVCVRSIWHRGECFLLWKKIKKAEEEEEEKGQKTTDGRQTGCMKVAGIAHTSSDHQRLCIQTLIRSSHSGRVTALVHLVLFCLRLRKY